MQLKDLAKKKLPDKPGVYFFLGPRKDILYIGKATSLRNRVRSYFVNDIEVKRSKLIGEMIQAAKGVEWTVTDSVLEALILEASLIRTHRPRCNTREKDDKSYNYLVITKEEFPRVLVMRGKDLRERHEEREFQAVYGPFPYGMLFREALKIIRKLFRFYDTNRPVGEFSSKMSKGTFDFNRQIGLYPSEQNREEYARTIRHIKLFFSGKKKQLVSELRKDMMRYAKAQEFERAHDVKRKIFALEHINDMALIKREAQRLDDFSRFRIEAYDVAHISGQDMVGVMTVVNDDEMDKSQYRKFKIKSVSGSNDPKALKEILDRRLAHDEWPMPRLIVVDGNTIQKSAAEHVLRKYDIMIPVVAVVKDEFHRPKRLIGPTSIVKNHEHGILLANAEAHRFAVGYHRSKRDKIR